MSKSDVRFYVGNMDEDAADIIDLCGLWWEDSLFYKEYGVEYAPAIEGFQQMFDAGMLILICGRSRATDELVATYVATVMPYIFNPKETHVSEIVWCIHPDYRKSSILFRLLWYIEKIISEMPTENPPLMSLCVSQEDKFKPLERNLTGKRGFKLMDKVFFKRAGDAHG